MNKEIDYENLEQILSVSAGDNASVSGNDNVPANIYIVGIPQDSAADQTEQEISYTLFNKPLEEYTVSEGLLLIIVTLAVIAFIYHMVKGGLSWLGW